GHRTVLITGQIDVFVEPLADMFDVIVAGEMEKDRSGRWTGHLATSPLVDEARAAWLERYARDEGVDLSASYAYGDTYSDRPWLDAVGHPNVVNPDPSLYRYARAKRWPVHSWTTTAEGRFSPVWRSITGASKRASAVPAPLRWRSPARPWSPAAPPESAWPSPVLWPSVAAT